MCIRELRKSSGNKRLNVYEASILITVVCLKLIYLASIHKFIPISRHKIIVKLIYEIKNSFNFTVIEKLILVYLITFYNFVMPYLPYLSNYFKLNTGIMRRIFQMFYHIKCFTHLILFKMLIQLLIFIRDKFYVE